MPVPAGPGPHLVLIKSTVSFASLDRFLNLPALTGHVHDLLQRRLFWGTHPMIDNLGGIGEAAAHHDPGLPAIGYLRIHFAPGPLIPAWSLRSPSCGESIPAPGMLACEPLINSNRCEAFRESHPDLILGGHGQHGGDLALGQEVVWLRS